MNPVNTDEGVFGLDLSMWTLAIPQGRFFRTLVLYHMSVCSQSQAAKSNGMHFE